MQATAEDHLLPGIEQELRASHAAAASVLLL